MQQKKNDIKKLLVNVYHEIAATPFKLFSTVILKPTFVGSTLAENIWISGRGGLNYVGHSLRTY